MIVCKMVVMVMVLTVIDEEDVDSDDDSYRVLGFGYLVALGCLSYTDLKFF